MRALFYTTRTSDCENHVRAWNSFAAEPAVHVTYEHRGIRNDWRLAEAVREAGAGIAFYIGAHEAPGNPRPDALCAARRLAPLVNLCSDAADRPWHRVLRGYRSRGCFDLQVSIDGALGSPADMTTLTPVDPRPFRRDGPRHIRCGFSGSVGRWNARSETLKALQWFGGLTVRERGDSYDDHAEFLMRCRMVLNLSFTGTGHAHHIKGRVVEAGWAGACLLESEGSPIGAWFPPDCYLTYRDAPHAAELIRVLDDATIERAARRLGEEVRAKYRADQIYGGIAEAARVAAAKPRPAA